MTELTAGRYYSNRMLLRHRPARQRVYDYAQNMQWPLVREVGDPPISENFWADFHVDPGTALHYVEDFPSRQPYIYVSGASAAVTEKTRNLVRADLAAYSINELLHAVDQSTGLDRSRAIMRLGVSAPPEFNDDVFERIKSGLESDDADVRHLSVWASTYSPWSQYAPLVRQIAEHDEAHLLHERATELLNAFPESESSES